MDRTMRISCSSGEYKRVVKEGVEKQNSTVNFKGLIGFIQGFINQAPSNIADIKDLQGAVQNQRLV